MTDLHKCDSGQCVRMISKGSLYCCPGCDGAWNSTPRYDSNGYHFEQCDDRWRDRSGGFCGLTDLPTATCLHCTPERSRQRKVLDDRPMHPGSRACPACYDETPEQFQAFATLRPHVPWGVPGGP